MKTVKFNVLENFLWYVSMDCGIMCCAWMCVWDVYLCLWIVLWCLHCTQAHSLAHTHACTHIQHKFTNNYIIADTFKLNLFSNDDNEEASSTAQVVNINASKVSITCNYMCQCGHRLLLLVSIVVPSNS